MTTDNTELAQFEIEKWFHTTYGNERWTVVYQNASFSQTGYALFACLVSPGSISDSLKSYGWDLQIGTGGPGFSQQREDGEVITCYHSKIEQHLEALVHVRSFPQGRDKYTEISEELKLLFNLYEDKSSGRYYELQSDGQEVEVIREISNRIEMRTSFLRRYLAARQMGLLLQIDSAVWLRLEASEHQPTLPNPREIRSDNCALTFYAGAGSDKVFSTLLGKKVLLPPSRTQMDLWPFEQEEQFLDFIIGEDETGEVIEHTCDPDQLANNFGKNVGAPHYLTPVFFDPEVLRKYYENGDKYTVGDGSVLHSNLWILRIDNNHRDHVIVFLGDLGRDIPHSERRHWRSYNLPTEERGMSDTAIRRSIMGQFADAESPEHQLKYRYEEADKAWQHAFSWPLFLPLHFQDQHVLRSLRRLLSETNSEFDSQVLNLAKLLVDSLNVSQLVANTIERPKKDDKSIVKFERFLGEQLYPHTQRDMSLLRTIQGLRSKGAAHLKGHNYDVSMAGLNPNNLKESFETLLERSTTMLDSLVTWVDEKTETGQ